MHNRFGFRDLVYTTLLVAALVMLGLTLRQLDRHWERNDEIRTALTSEMGTLDGRVEGLIQRFDQLLEALYDIQEGQPQQDGEASEPADTEAEPAEAGEPANDVDAADDEADGDTAAAFPTHTVPIAAGDLRNRTLNLERIRNAQLPPRGQGAFDESHAFHRRLQVKQRDDFAYGDWLVNFLGSRPNKLTPVVLSDAVQSEIEQYVIEPMITRDPETLEWRPVVARSWEMSEDGMQIRFELRDDVTFSDGKPLTSEDVVWSYEWIMNPQVNAPHLRSYYGRFESVEADGPHAVVFSLAEPYFRALDFAGGIPILARHWYGRFTEEDFNRLPGLLFGTGPYRLPGDPRAWRPGSGPVTLVRNDRYWGPRPPFERLVWEVIDNPTARAVSYRQGRIDTLSPAPEEHGSHKENPRMVERGPMFEFFSPTAGYRYIGWNQRRDGEPTFFADVRVRRAMTMLTHREVIVDQIMHGLGKVTSGPFNPLSAQYNQDIEPWPYDVKQARRLLAEAGFSDRNGDGVLQDADGNDFVFTLTYPSGVDFYHEMALLLRDSYMRAGIIMRLDRLEWSTLIQRLDTRQFDAITLGWTASLESDPYQIFHSSQIEGSGHNFVSLRNSELDEAIEQGRRTMDKQQRMRYWHQVHRILHEEQPYTFLFTVKSVRYVDGRFQNVRQLQAGLTPILEWYVPREEQRY